MVLKRAVDADFAAIVRLANLAYRGSGGGDGPNESWCSESGIVEGLRLTEAQLREDLAAKPHAFLLTCRDTIDGQEDSGGPLLGTVWLEPYSNGTWYLGLLTVNPALQNRQLGRSLLAGAEDFSRERGATRMRMTVVNVRATLIAWYLRRGYNLTGETQPFPYHDEQFGRPLRDDLHFVVLAKML